MPPEDVGVNVDEPCGDVEARGIGDRARAIGGDVGGDLRDLAGGYRDVHDRVDAVARIDDVAVLDQEIERRVLRLQRLPGVANREPDEREGRDRGDSSKRGAHGHHPFRSSS